MNAFGTIAILSACVTMPVRGRVPVLFNSACTQDKINGDPKSVRIEKRNLSDTSGSIEAALQEVASYFRDGKLEERMTYHSDGTLAFRLLYQHSDGGALLSIVTFDGTGKELTVTTRSRSANTEEEVVAEPGGKVLTRTVNHLDGDRVIESILTGSSGESELHQTSRYDAAGRLVGNEVVFELGMPGTPARIETLSLGDHVTITAYAPDGATLHQTEMACTGDTTKTTQTINTGNRTVQRIITERVESRDSYGNWTKKTSYESYDPNDEGVAIASLYRTITYY